ncbi:MAG: o-succinylbenzoate synthase [Propionibacteriaceae bacterium]|jgi:O-succinylbenzoate synthase|nr:o-succinylbenzoate synthase [Propionibacteriaceae bacterium]
MTAPSAPWPVDWSAAGPAQPAAAVVYDIPLRLPFRGQVRRRGMVWPSPAGWVEWSPFPDYGPSEAAAWLRATAELAQRGWPAPRRSHVPVNTTVPATDPETAHDLVAASGCATAKVKVAQAGQSLAQDLARVEAVRHALGPSGRLRLDANGAWSLDQADRALAQLARFDLEYVEQPCASVADLAQLRRRLRGRVLIAADESIRRADDPLRVVAERACDIAVLKVQPLGGVWRCLELAERLGLPVVVSSAVETSIGLAAGLALAAALPELPYACGLGTASLLRGDLTADPLLPRDGQLEVRPVALDPALAASWRAQPALSASWWDRLSQARRAASTAAAVSVGPAGSGVRGGRPGGHV